MTNCTREWRGGRRPKTASEDGFRRRQELLAAVNDELSARDDFQQALERSGPPRWQPATLNEELLRRFDEANERRGGR